MKSEHHNRALLQFLSNEISMQEFMSSLRVLLFQKNDDMMMDQEEGSSRESEFLVTILARYNAALVLFCSNKIIEAREFLLPFKKSLVKDLNVHAQEFKFDLITYYSANALFLLLDCGISYMAGAEPLRKCSIVEEVDEIVCFLEEYIDVTKCSDIMCEQTQTSYNRSLESNSECAMNAIVGAIDEMKFRLVYMFAL